MAWNWDRDYKGDSTDELNAAQPDAPAADAGMEDFLASAKQLTERFLEQSRGQAARILADANAQAEQIVSDARRQAEELMRDAEKYAEDVTLHAREEADALLEQAKLEAEQQRKPGTVDQEYAVRCVSECFDAIREKQEEMVDLLNAHWQKFLIDLMPSEEEPPAPPAEPESAPDGEAPPETSEVPQDLEERISALSREMEEIFWSSN